MKNYKKALVTGASSGIGLSISKALLDMNISVYGIGRDFSRTANELTKYASLFTEINADLAKPEDYISKIKNLNKDGISFDLLVNSAGTAYYGLHESISTDQISEMIRVNLEAPMIISRLLLNDLKKSNGTIVNISSVTAHGINTHACTYGASKAGLDSFGHSLFNEVRKHNIAVINIAPDMTDTNLYRNADFTVDSDEAAYIKPEEVADAVVYALNTRDSLVVSDITLHPQYHRIAKKGKMQ